MLVYSAGVCGLRIPPIASCPQHVLFETKMENTMKQLRGIFNNRVLLVPCALGFLCASPGLVPAHAEIGRTLVVYTDNHGESKANLPKNKLQKQKTGSGAANPDAVQIQGVQGNTNANGTFIANKGRKSDGAAR